MDLTAGEQLGSYRLIGRIGSGGMGEVWKAEDSRLGRTVAIKVLNAGIADNAESKARFEREARTAAQLYHPNIAMIHAIESVEDRSYIVMEYVIGEPLSILVRRGTIAEAEVCRIGSRVADALAEAHAHGIVHRDIKPDNVIVSGEKVKVLDFGIAKRTEAISAARSKTDPTEFVTDTGVVVGTVSYMSPEQALGRAVDSRTDIFSLGIVLHLMLTGSLPFEGETMPEVLTKIIRDDPTPVHKLRPGVSSLLGQIVDRCLRKDRELRFESATELASALRKAGEVVETQVDPVQVDLPALSPMVPAPVSVTAETDVFVSAGRTEAVSPASVDRQRFRWRGVIVVLLAIVVAGGIYLSRRTRDAEVSKTGPVAIERPHPPPAIVPENGTVSMAVVENVPENDVPSSTVVEVAAAPAKPNLASPESGSKQVETNKKGSEASPVPARVPDTDLDAQYARGLTLVAQNHLIQAYEIFEQVLIRDPHYAPARVRVGMLRLLRGDNGVAQEQFRAALADSQRLTDQDRRMAEIGLLIASGENDKARAQAAAYEAVYPNDPAFQQFKEALEKSRERQKLLPIRPRRRLPPRH